ncbi:HAD hydrolase family protein, partial [uncultured Brachyspira sp.]
DFIFNMLKKDNNIEKILTAGDSNNDIEMIKKYNGYIYINANEKIKKITDKYFNLISDIIYKEL